MAVAGGEGTEGAMGCPVNAHDAFDMLLVVTEFVALICVLLSALLLALQFSMRCLPFLQNVQLYPAVVVATMQKPSTMVLTFTFLAGNLRMTPVCEVVLLSTFPARVSSHLNGGATC